MLVMCAGDGEVRLEGGELAEEHAYGRLEVFLRGFWSDVCSTEKFTPASARVACRQLGYDGGAGLLFPRPYESGGRFVDPNLVRLMPQSPCPEPAGCTHLSTVARPMHAPMRAPFQPNATVHAPRPLKPYVGLSHAISTLNLQFFHRDSSVAACLRSRVWRTAGVAMLRHGFSHINTPAVWAPYAWGMTQHGTQLPALPLVSSGATSYPAMAPAKSAHHIALVGFGSNTAILCSGAKGVIAARCAAAGGVPTRWPRGRRLRWQRTHARRMPLRRFRHPRLQQRNRQHRPRLRQHRPRCLPRMHATHAPSRCATLPGQHRTHALGSPQHPLATADPVSLILQCATAVTSPCLHPACSLRSWHQAT